MPAAQPVLPPPESRDLALTEAVIGDMIGRLAKLAPELSHNGVTEEHRQAIHRYAGRLVHFTAAGMPVRQS